MQFATLDICVRRTLLNKGLPIHYYSEVLFHQADALRILARDTLQLVNTVNLKINDYGAVDLPGDFQDDVGLSLPFGGLLQPIPKKDSLTPLRIHNPTTGAFVPYETNNVNTLNYQANTIYGYNPGAFWFWNINDWGEPTGRYFGANGGATNGYKVIRERRQIQLIGMPDTTSVVLMYVSNGLSVDNATQLDWRAFDAVQSYNDWKRSPNSSIKDSPEAATWYNERRLARAAIDPLTITDIVNVLRSNFTGAAKN